MTLSGQGCVLPTRLYVHDDVYDEVVEGVAAAADALVLGDPFDPATQLGPVVSEAAQERILGVIADAQRDGAKLLAGGDRGTGELADGYYVQPTVFGDVDQESALAQGEVFGPVLACLRFEDDDDALAKANDSDFGLGAYLHTRDLARAHRFAAELESGTVHVNGFSGMTPTAPFGGVKSSGFGREGGRAGIEEFVRPKSVFIANMSIRLTEDEVWEELATARTGIFTTLRADGWPVSLPVWFATVDRRIYLRTPAGTKKLRAHPARPAGQLPRRVRRAVGRAARRAAPRHRHRARRRGRGGGGVRRPGRQVRRLRPGGRAGAVGDAPGVPGHGRGAARPRREGPHLGQRPHPTAGANGMSEGLLSGIRVVESACCSTATTSACSSATSAPT